MLILKQSTASQSVLLGPFVDDTDGATAETGLTIANTDIRLSANGGNMFAKTSGGGTHDENGWYTITLDATDTATVGRLQISCKVAGALAVFMECQVVEEAVSVAFFDALAPGYVVDQPVNVTKVGGTTQTAGDIPALVTTVDGVVDTINTNVGTNGAALTGITGVQLAADQAVNATKLGGAAVTATTSVTFPAASTVATTTGAVGSVTGAVGSVTGHTNQTGDSFAIVNGSAGLVAIDTVVDAIKAVTDALPDAGALTTLQADTDDIQTRLPDALDGGAIKADLLSISGSTTAADNLEASMVSVLPFTVTGTPTSTEVAATGLTALTGGDDVLIGRVIVMTSGNAIYEAARITDYDDATGAMTVTTMAITPSASDTGVIV